MTMEETERDILSDLDELSGDMEIMEYLLEIAAHSDGIPGDAVKNSMLVADCQADTRISAEYDKEGKFLFKSDSQSLIIKGILALLGEIYNGRSRDEISRFNCAFVKDKRITGLLNSKQKRGLSAIAGRMKQSPA